MEPQAVLTTARDAIALLLSQLDPTPTAAWVTAETNRIMEQFNGATPPELREPS